MPCDRITTERIRERAYDMWDRNHRPDGFDVEFWLMAERELKVEAATTETVPLDEGNGEPVRRATHDEA